MCIYYKNRPSLHYDSKEHIFPSAVGGKSTLPNDYVSREFNSDISKFERDLIRDGFVSVMRQFEGPGKRGSLNANKASKSKVHIISSTTDNTLFALGYTSQGKLRHIPHLSMNVKTGEVLINFDAEDTSKDQFKEAFVNNLLHVDFLRIKVSIENKLPDEIVLLGIEDNVEENFNCFIFKNQNNNHSFSGEYIRKIVSNLKFNSMDTKIKQYEPVVSQDFIFQDNHLRVLGKIAFNYLAKVKGKDFVMLDNFNPIRNWISMGAYNSNINVQAIQYSNIRRLFKIPPSSHSVVITQIHQMFIAEVSLYGHFTASVVLGNDIQGLFGPKGLICDWKNNSEYDLHQYLMSTNMPKP